MTGPLFAYINNNTKIIQIKDEARKYAMGNDEGFLIRGPPPPQTSRRKDRSFTPMTIQY
jgi:hypothetical protein